MEGTHVEMYERDACRDSLLCRRGGGEERRPRLETEQGDSSLFLIATQAKHKSDFSALQINPRST
jgi:hypothetical protein